jgi:hypothetical protein
LGAAVDEANARVTTANAAAAAAEARASAAASEALEAKARAAEAEAALSLAKNRSGQVLAPEQESRVVEKLLAMPPSIFDVQAAPDPDAQAAMTQIGNMLKAAQWRVQDAPSGAGPIAEAPEGITIEIAESKRLEWEPTVIGLVLALREEGIQVAAQASAEADPSAVHVVIGAKAGTTWAHGREMALPAPGPHH